MRDSAIALAPRSRALLALDFDDGPIWEPSTGHLVARSGQRFTWSRGTTLASVNAVGGTYTAPATMPAWESVDDGIRTRLGLRCGVDDVVRESQAVGWLPQPISGVIRFIERGAVAVNDATLVAITPDTPTTGVRFFVHSNGTRYALTADNGTDDETIVLPSGVPTAGQLVEIGYEWTASGLMLRQSIQRAAPVSVRAALTLPTSWGGARIRIGRRGTTHNPAALTLLGLYILPGVYDDTTIEEAY